MSGQLKPATHREQTFIFEPGNLDLENKMAVVQCRHRLELS
jgi:hypothetical protein